MIRIVLIIAGLLAGMPCSWAWSIPGHMVTGAMTYDILKQDAPQALAAAIILLKAHPSYEKLWKKRVESAPVDEQDLYLLMYAPRWADDIRRTEYDRPTWHYITNWYTPPGKTAPSTIPDAPAENALTAFHANLDQLKTSAEVTERAVALTWLCHLVGDIHQPMHTTSLLTQEYPEGDRGGNRFFIKVTATSQPINLHYFWDGLLTNTEDFRQARNIATELRLRPQFARHRLAELSEKVSFTDWVAESHALAKSEVYRHGQLAGGTAEFSAELLPAGYTRQAKAVAERRAVVASYRLADVIQKALTTE